jgi:coenzyme F420-reducing hydrogenase alpha subunit
VSEERSIGGLRRFSVQALTRVEGEGSLRVRVRDGVVEIAEFSIYEPPRFFEKLLVGREVREVPDIVARICGICPVAYQMSACHALEQALGIETTPAIETLRRLLYCGEWLQSHALHVHLLHAPDFLGYESGFTMAADHRALVEGGLRLKALGNRIMEVLGGRAVHPINVTVGGFHRAPSAAAIRPLPRARGRDGPVRLPGARRPLREREPAVGDRVSDERGADRLLGRPRHRRGGL